VRIVGQSFKRCLRAGRFTAAAVVKRMRVGGDPAGSMNIGANRFDVRRHLIGGRPALRP